MNAAIAELDGQRPEAASVTLRGQYETMNIAFTGDPDADFARGMVPHHQGAIDWHSVRASGRSFAFIKASEGADFRDTRFSENTTDIGPYPWEAP